MRAYDVYQHPTRGFKAVKAGFSWPGFFFGWIWCFCKGLVLKGLGILGVSMIVSFIFTDNDVMLFLCSFFMAMVIGWSGNEWRGAKLADQGFTTSGRFEAANSETAVAEALRVAPATPATIAA